MRLGRSKLLARKEMVGLRGSMRFNVSIPLSSNQTASESMRRPGPSGPLNGYTGGERKKSPPPNKAPKKGSIRNMYIYIYIYMLVQYLLCKISGSIKQVFGFSAGSWRV